MKKILSKIESKLKSKLKILIYRVLKNRTVLVHTLGKVGSSTIYHELKKVSPWDNIFHTHFLSDEWLHLKLKEGNHFEVNNKMSQKVFAHFKLYPNNKKYIISLVREPVSREISNFMQNPEDFVDGNILDMSNENLKKAYLNKLNYDYTFNWFDSEFLNYTGFDVFSEPFDKEKGFSIYQYEGFNILILKLERLNECYTEAMKIFLGLNLSLEGNANQSSQKPIAHVYSELRKTIKFSEAALNKVYSHKYVTHFYTEGEIQGFTSKYLK
ncbi:putative capsular polysaccharide synthesis family protein [Lacinutrix jangbogonensis]|uniref:putative capsular polysaccharide synthesis family protein n=1 Tax=Lacinutrix jangbogonensis TaxID=1469557 RepID=UPI00053D0089|nr:putative capsular polysaccharide synthesis family protein [Lacinutrix jangbogonensis]